MKTAELEGALLDYWVARALSDRQVRIVGAEEHELCETRFGDQWSWNRFSPSRAWMDGGPIFEREKLDLTPPKGLRLGWYAGHYDVGLSVGGPTLLVAAMRAFVYSKFGDAVPNKPRAG